ncbi:MAG: hypothetical protein IMW93_08300 [Thermoanaerobacteraceae bacterium]|nr:hypothetical protein [Thermoanaerobacteraceae bacterium]
MAGFRSVYVDRKSIRIIRRVVGAGEIDVAVIVGITEREGLPTYRLAARRRADVEQFIDDLLRSFAFVEYWRKRGICPAAELGFLKPCPTL